MKKPSPNGHGGGGDKNAKTSVKPSPQRQSQQQNQQQQQRSVTESIIKDMTNASFNEAELLRMNATFASFEHMMSSFQLDAQLFAVSNLLHHHAM